MAFKYHFRDDDGDLVEFTERVQVGFSANPGTDGLVMNAEEGSVGSSEIRVEDPDGDWDFPKGHRKVIVTEDECAGDDYGTAVFIGYTANRSFERDLKRTGAARIITVQLVDINTAFERRIMDGADANRPAETDVARITWAEATNEGSLIDDTLYFSTAGPVNMDAVDYRGQSFRNIFDDCSQQSGKNWFLWRHGELFSLWYGPRGTTDFSSDIKISNVLSDVDNSTVFAPALSSKLTRDPSRVYSGVYLSYASSHVYKQRESTAATFARRDSFISAPNVKSKAQANARANRVLSDISTEEDTITTSIIVPRHQANDVVAGQRIQVKYTHFDGYEDYVWTRVLNRTVREVGKDQIELALEVSPDEPINTPSSTVFATLQRCIAYDVLPYCYFAQPGDTPLAGDPTLPTVGPITYIQDVDNPYGPSGWTYNGMLIGGTGTIDVKFYTSTIGITPVSVTFSITLNGVPVASYTGYNANTGYGNDLVPPLTVTGLAVSNGDILRATCVASPQGVPFFRSPRGTGNGEEALTITGGSLV